MTTSAPSQDYIEMLADQSRLWHRIRQALARIERFDTLA